MNSEHGRRLGGGRRSRRRTVVVLVCAAILTAGCASMPDSGGVHRVDASKRADSESQVQVFGVPPRKGEHPSDILRGFLEATTSDEADFDTARQYLTKEAAEQWRPFSQTTVLSDGPVPRLEGTPADWESGTAVAVLSGRQRALVDQKQAYRPQEGVYETRVQLKKESGEWRIDGPPDGLVLGESDFERIYRSVNAYYFARPAPPSEGAGGGQGVLVADPVYLRKRIDLITSSVKALLRGPSSWLDPVADSRFPSGAGLADPEESLSLDDSNSLRVRLDERGANVRPSQCRQMAAQVLFTVQDLASAKVDEVELAREDGSRLCTVPHSAAQVFAPAGLKSRSEQQYFIDEDDRLARLSPGDVAASRVRGPFGDGQTHLKWVGIDRSEQYAAGVSLDSRSLYVAAMQSGAERGPAVLVSGAKREADGLTAPSWDGHGDLWIADRDPERPRLLWLRGGTAQPEEVVVPSLGNGRIEALRVASDGVRIALLVERDGRTSLELGRVERTGETPGKPQLTVNDLRLVTPQLEQVDSASWAGSSRLVVVGREAGGVQQLQYVETDGSASNTPTLPGISGVESVAASEDENKPLIADSEDGIVRLPPDANWQLVSKNGSAPVYPG
ncbi:LpqB family beta-propeller domain-containing protein [Streptomyces sp. TP-A0874]|uniref:LpqB family beta-propeller domain-containing protein n=1 Tax=Streptomyces sp. TP-A0874 TaxID=549819 RepID=UPI000852F91F|nr:LpqB family beta-propeller domain-containing protein [Streptomyces sp. TP-A0874]